MAWRARLSGGFHALFRKHKVERDLDDELREYLEGFWEQALASFKAAAEAEERRKK